MVEVSLHVYGAERTCGAQILAGSAAYATLDVDGGDFGRILSVGIRRHHGYGLRGTVAGAVAALDVVGEGYAVLLDPHGVAYLYRRLVGCRDRIDGSRGAHLRALHALGTAVAAFVRHGGLHERHEARRGTQHPVGTYRHAELAARAMLRHVACAERSRGRDRSVALGSLLVEDRSQTSVHFHLLGFGGRGGQKAHACDEVAARRVGFRGLFVRFTPPRIRVSCGGTLALVARAAAVFYGTLVAGVDAVHAGHAAAVIDGVVLDVDARGLAVAGAALAVDAFRSVDHGLQ